MTVPGTRFCGQCGERVLPGVRFCSRCGAVQAGNGAPHGGFDRSGEPPRSPEVGYGAGPHAQAPLTAVRPYASMWRRVAAYLIDVVFLVLVFGPILAWLGSSMLSGPFDTLRERDDAIASYSLLASGLGIAVNAAYFIPQWALRGASLGQQWLSLRVVDAAVGSNVTFGRAALRWLLMTLAPLVLIGVVLPIVSTAIISWPAVLLVTAAMSPTRQGLHDQVVHSMVVDHRREAQAAMSRA